MTNQTPAEALDDILRKIDKCIEDGEGVGYDYYGGNIMADEPFTLSDIKVAITAYAATVERETDIRARIDGLQRLIGAHNNDPSVDRYDVVTVTRELLNARLAALQGAQKETDEPTM